ncbi:hypothetical protein PCE1_001382 [Barthelona sp. PCE]
MYILPKPLKPDCKELLVSGFSHRLSEYQLSMFFDDFEGFEGLKIESSKSIRVRFVNHNIACDAFRRLIATSVNSVRLLRVSWPGTNFNMDSFHSLYVSFDANITEPDIFEFFSQVSTSISSVKLMNEQTGKKLFAFVFFADICDRNRCLAELNGSTYKGVTFKVNTSVTKSRIVPANELIAANVPGSCVVLVEFRDASLTHSAVINALGSSLDVSFKRYDITELGLQITFSTVDDANTFCLQIHNSDDFFSRGLLCSFGPSVTNEATEKRTRERRDIQTLLGAINNDVSMTLSRL